jgi:hypothetical protein
LHGDGATWRETATGSKGPITALVDCGRGRPCALDVAGLLPNIDTTERPCHDPQGDCPHDEPAEPEGDRILRWSGRRWSSPQWIGQFPRHLASSGDTLWALAENGLISRKGKSETVAPLEADSDLASPHGLWIGSHDDGWVVGRRCREGTQGPVCDRGAIWRVHDAKAKLVPLGSSPPGLYAVWGWPGGAVAVGQGHAVVLFDGTTWKTVP